ncbi:hypothetical protein HanRHA438_Chr07g0313461 [Helianthus annuus]|nr:hypothetical protein HanRHA438_Chr07g0313461 [Helianthus annuus]
MKRAKRMGRIAGALVIFTVDANADPEAGGKIYKAEMSLLVLVR